MTQTEFQTEIRDALLQIDPALAEEAEKDAFYAALYDYVEQYALEKQLRNTAVSLPLVQHILRYAAKNPVGRFGGNAATHMAYFRHALAAAAMLIDLRLPVSREEEDIILAAALCHVIPENIRVEDLEKELIRQDHLDSRAYRIVKLLFWANNDAGAEQKEYFDKLLENKMALIIKLADRGNLLEQLYGISNLSAHRYIFETRNFFFPLCIAAKARYPEFMSPISVMMEKMRCLTEAAEILLSRYEAREAELLQDIQALQEENATFRRMIRILGEKDA